MTTRLKSEIVRLAPSKLMAAMLSDGIHESQEAGLKLVKEASSYGLNVRDYLRLAADVHLEEDANLKARLSTATGVLNGYEACLALANLPIANDFDNGVTLQLAADSFASKKGLRALFPEVIEDVVRWQHKQDQWASMDGMLANSRTISGVELVTKITVDDDSDTHGTFTVPEFGRIPTFTLSAGEHAIKFYKHGSALKTSYEFERRVSLDLITPYLARVEREKQIGLLANSYHIMVNGDGVHNAAMAEDLKDAKWGGDFTNGKTLKDNYRALAKFLASRARSGNYIDTIAGNIDTYLELFFMFAPTNVVKSEMEHLQMHGAPKVNLTLPIFNDVNFKLIPQMPDNQLLCFSKNDTLEQLTEAGSKIAESEKSIINQSYYYSNTENMGFRLLFDDTRTVLSF